MLSSTALSQNSHEVLPSDPAEIYLAAKKLWFEGKTYEQISVQTGVAEYILKKWITAKDGWRAEKNKLEEKIVAATYQIEKRRFHKLLNDMLLVAEKGTENLLKFAMGELTEIDPILGLPIPFRMTPKEINQLVGSAKTIMEMTQGDLPGDLATMTRKLKLSHKDVLEQLQLADQMISYDAKKDDSASS